jgi:putative transposase
MQPLFRNDVFQLDDVRYRVVHIDNPAGKLYGYPIDDPKGFPREWDIRDITLLHSQNALKLVADHAHQVPLAMSAAGVAVSERRWATVSGLLANPGELMTRATRGAAINAHVELVRVSDRHLWTLLRLLWRFGMNKTSLQSNFHNCGRISVSTKNSVRITIKAPTGKELVVLSPASHKARGRRPIYKDYVPYAYPEGLKEQIVADIRALYLKDETVSIRFVQDEVMRKYFSLRDANGDLLTDEHDLPLLRPLGDKPSNEQIRYLIKKTVPEHEAYAKRVSPESFNNDFARSDGTVHDDCVGPGDVYEIDATIVDVVLVSQFHRAVAIGKATLYLVVDRDTNLIVGFHLCLNKPSWEGAKRAILGISSDWEALCHALGVKFRAEDWPARNTFPNRFFTDRGEGISEKSNVVVLGPNIEVTTAPRASPRRKCRVEGNFFYTIGVFLKDLAGGFEPPTNRTKRLAKKYDKDMRYNLDELAGLILKAILRHNHMVRASETVEPKLLYEGFRATPINLWNYRVVNSTGLLSRTSFDEMRQKLLPKDVAKMTQDGILFKGLFYKFDHQRFPALCALASRGAKIELLVQYDTKVDQLWVSEKSNPQVQYPASLASKSIAMKGATWAEVSDYQDARRAQKFSDAEYNQSVRIGYAENVTRLDEELGTLAKDAAKGVPRETQHRLGVEARRIEMDGREAAHQDNESAAAVAIQGLNPLAVEETPRIDVDAADADGESTTDLEPTETHHEPIDRASDCAHSALATPPHDLPYDDYQNLYLALDGGSAKT